MNRTEPTKPNGKDRTVAQVIVTPTSSTQGWSLETAKTRINYDPVLDIDVTEYQIPYNKVTIDKRTEDWRQGCDWRRWRLSFALGQHSPRRSGKIVQERGQSRSTVLCYQEL